MTDAEIVALYWARKEQAITESESAYGGYCRSIAWNILKNRLDTEECVNDTWLRAWNAMPPQKPGILSVFLGTITRNLSLDRWRNATAKKRGSGQLQRAFDELEYCVSAGVSLEDRITQADLSRLLARFLQDLNQKDRCVFVRRYWYTDPIYDIAHRYRMTESAVKVSLHRTRNKLKLLLELEGYTP